MYLPNEGGQEEESQHWQNVLVVHVSKKMQFFSGMNIVSFAIQPTLRPTFHPLPTHIQIIYDNNFNTYIQLKFNQPTPTQYPVANLHQSSTSNLSTQTDFRVATAQGKQGIWLSLFPDRENTGNLGTTQGIFPTILKMKYFIVNCPFIDWCAPIFSSLTSPGILPQTFIMFMLFPHTCVRLLVWHVKTYTCNEREEMIAVMGW